MKHDSVFGDLGTLGQDDRVERLIRGLIVLAAVLASAALWWPAQAHAARIKEVASVQGVRSNPLVGYGLVVGLDGTGDQTTSAPFTTQSLNAMLQQMGVTVPPGASMQLKNVAAVMVTAQLPPFAQPGQAVDVVVSSMGNAKSLRGGTLIATPLKGADGQVYALAQGNVVVGGAGASAAGSKVQINHLSAGRIPDGATVERSVPTPLNQGEYLQLDLNSNDYHTAREVARAINGKMGEGTAQAMDGRVVRVRMPATPDARVAFLADVENLDVAQAVPAARVVINARTGSIVMNQAVTLSSCAVAHGNLSVTISSTPVVSQPGPFSNGSTVSRDKADITINQQPGSIIQMPAGTQLVDVVKALNSLGATPQDLLAILQAIKAAGALNAELEVI
ncbi:MAG: flagellar basal body P-ring protein FlgI [Piscinibacter sp.]|uniref:flagellar basal body P-ring protein FlgI n=1 Tax=Piscinibacter TaxID=1114981 RepID=UPI000FDCFAD0|nr:MULTISPECIES: flagellar basal body P-ring protein FlgI [Piscinibacter]MCW5662277.1 flagellar basal body P-ring protein FlgI [Piscinibacter sp.]